MAMRDARYSLFLEGLQKSHLSFKERQDLIHQYMPWGIMAIQTGRKQFVFAPSGRLIARGVSGIREEE